MTLYRVTMLLAAAVASGCDKSDPTAVAVPPDFVRIPVVDSGKVTAWYTAEVAARNGVAYTTTWGGFGGAIREGAIHVWDVSRPSMGASSIVTLPDSYATGDVTISEDGRTLLVAGNGPTGGFFVLYDLADPLRPQLLSRTTTAGTRGDVHTAKFGVVNGRSYAFLANARDGQLVIADVTNARAPVEIAVMKVGNPIVHDVFVRGGLLFVAGWNEGLSIWDIGGGGKGGTPANPVRVSQVSTVGGKAHNVWWYHDRHGSKRYAFVGEELFQGIDRPTAGDMHVIDLSNLESPREVAFYRAPGGGVHNFWMDEARGQLFIAAYAGGVFALDVTGDLSKCSLEQTGSQSRCDLGKMNRARGSALTEAGHMVWGVSGDGAYLYASDMLNGIYKLDIGSLR